MSYQVNDKRLKTLHDSITGWAEFSFVIGGIAWHKQEDLENRLSKHVMPMVLRIDELETCVRMCQEAFRRLRVNGSLPTASQAALDKCIAALPPSGPVVSPFTDKNGVRIQEGHRLRSAHPDVHGRMTEWTEIVGFGRYSNGVMEDNGIHDGWYCLGAPGSPGSSWYHALTESFAAQSEVITP